MKKQLLITGLLFICGNLYAEKCAVQRPDGGITVIEYIDGSSDSISDVLSEFGYDGKECVQVKSIPSNRKDREFWKIEGNSIVVDSIKKQEKAVRDAEESLSRDAVLDKLKISKDEFIKLRGIK